MDPNERVPVNPDRLPRHGEKELKAFYEIKEPDELTPFIDRHLPEQMREIIQAIDLKGMATYLNKWKTGSIHRTKILEL